MCLEPASRGGGPPGLRLANFRECFEGFAPAVLLLGLLLLAAGILLETSVHARGPGGLAGTGLLPWGVFQQYLLNGYFVNRLVASVSAAAS